MRAIVASLLASDPEKSDPFGRELIAQLKLADRFDILSRTGGTLFDDLEDSEDGENEEDSEAPDESAARRNFHRSTCDDTISFPSCSGVDKGLNPAITQEA
jgi:hypothetical protein